MDPDKLEEKVAGLVNLPTLPGIVRKISTISADSKSNASDVADLISTDQVLSAKILRLVNSPVYGFPGRISTVTHAVVLLGLNVVKGLVLGTAIFDTIGKNGKGMWMHSLGVALLSRRIAKELKIPDPEEVMMAGLLHDVGKVVLNHVDPEQYEEVLEIAQARSCHVAVIERETYGVDHARVGSWLARDWHFPSRLAEPLSYHHRPDLAKEAKNVTTAVHLADILARGMSYGHPGDDAMPPLNREAYSSLGISFDQIDKILEDTELEFAAGADVLTDGS